MGNAVTTPLALEERNTPFIRRPDLSHNLYTEFIEENIDSNRDLLHKVPDELSSRISLHQHVDLSFNLITELPIDLPLSLPHLRELNLSHNKLLTIPDSIFGFMHLMDLNLSFNCIETLPDGICLLDKLKKLNISNNRIKRLPSNMDQLRRLVKLNLACNELEHLPISLGNIPSLKIVLIFDNPLSSSGGEDNVKILDHLRSCYVRSLSPVNPLSLVNSFKRIRGSVFDSRVLNSGSAQSLFGQMQAQAVNTGNRLLTPMIPPTSATSLDAEKLKDAILGMFYGAILGDSIGLLTDFMTPDEASFHYDIENIKQEDMHQDEYRSRYRIGQVTPASHLVVLVLKSILKWAGVVDELDYTQRLAIWFKEYKECISSHVIEGIMQDEPAFLSSPTMSAKSYKDRIGEAKEDIYLLVDNMCLPPIVGLVISQFHDLKEVRENARRICGSTHEHENNKQIAIIFAEILAKLLQGNPLENVVEGIQLEEWNKADLSHPATSLDIMLKHIDIYRKSGFKAAMSKIVMLGGHSSINALVAGSVFGLVEGFQALPIAFLKSIDDDFRNDLDKKLNLLFDLMGVP